MIVQLVSRACLGGYRLACRARNKAFSLAIGHAFAGFGERTVVELPVRLAGENRILLGDDIFVGAGSWLQTLGNSDAPALEIGDGTSLAGYCVISAVASIRIGRRVTIARGVYIADHAHAYDRIDRPIKDQGITNIAAVTIEDGAWLGENAVLVPGVTIGAGAVVGANSVVTTDVPAHAVAIGVPARVVRRLKDPAAGPEAASA